MLPAAAVVPEDDENFQGSKMDRLFHYLQKSGSKYICLTNTISIHYLHGCYRWHQQKYFSSCHNCRKRSAWQDVHYPTCFSTQWKKLGRLLGIPDSFTLLAWWHCPFNDSCHHEQWEFSRDYSTLFYHNVLHSTGYTHPLWMTHCWLLALVVFMELEHQAIWCFVVYGMVHSVYSISSFLD